MGIKARVGLVESYVGELQGISERTSLFIHDLREFNRQDHESLRRAIKRIHDYLGVEEKVEEARPERKYLVKRKKID